MNPDAESGLEQDEAAEFLGGGTATAAEDDLADFLTTERPDSPSTGPGRWFTSRYDGSCDACFADFSEGEEIRADGEGGWQGRDCCGEDDGTPEQEQRRAERPKSLNRKVNIERGRYVMPHPTKRVKGQPAAWRATRATTFVKGAADHRALTAWELRCALVGLTLSPELVEEITVLLEGAEPAAVVKAQKDALNKLVERAKTAAGSSERSRHGTVLHKHTEELDAGRRTVEEVPELYRRDAAAYAAALELRGYRPVPELIERTTTVLGLQVMGTMDRVLLAPDGSYVIGDVKSGANALTYSYLEIAAQLAIYARGFNETGVAQWSGEGNPLDWRTWTWARPLAPDGSEIRVREDFAVVMHVPFGSGECELYEVDLEEGRRELAACDLVRSRHRIKSAAVMGPLRELEPAEPVTPRETAAAAYKEPESGDMLAIAARERSRPAPPSWEDRFGGVKTRQEASALYQEARSHVQELGMTRLLTLVALGKAALAELPPF